MNEWGYLNVVLGKLVQRYSGTEDPVYFLAGREHTRVTVTQLREYVFMLKYVVCRMAGHPLVPSRSADVKSDLEGCCFEDRGS
jgi:hypothetical protein